MDGAANPGAEAYLEQISTRIDEGFNEVYSLSPLSFVSGFKTVNNKVNSAINLYSIGQKIKIELKQRRAMVNYALHEYNVRAMVASVLLNSLPISLRHFKSTSAFRSAIKTHLFPSQ